MRRTLLSLCLLTAGAALGRETAFSDVQPILERRCAGCHRSGEIGPMPLTTYQEARPWAKAIREAVLGGAMPPWHADAETSRRIANSRLMPKEEIRAIADWVDAGAKEGTPVRRNAAPPEESGWRLGKPDLVIRVPGYPVPARGAVQYTFLVTPADLPADAWIAAAEWKIDRRTHVHHMNAFIRPPGSSYIAAAPRNEFYVASRTERAARRDTEREVDRRELLIGYEPGYRPIPWGEGRAKLLRKGSDIVFEMHYNTNGTPVVDYSELGLYFLKRAPRERVLSVAPADSKFAIPPGDANFRSESTATFTSEVKLISMQPHMHLRGKSFAITAAYPDGRSDILLRVPAYDFNWQTTYFLAQPLVLPAGTRLECVAHFDNSPNNRHNPDPAKTVTWGDQSWEEMAIGFLEVAFDAARDPDVAVLSDRPKPAPEKNR
jgi:hypothetical protein